MTDEIFDRQYQAGRKSLHASIDAAGRRLKGLVEGFKILNRIRFAAPWTKQDACRAR